MDLRTSQTIKLINKHLQIRKYLTKFCYLFIIGGILTYVFYAIIKTSEKYKLVSDLANNANHYKTEKIMINPRINFQHNDNKIYEIIAKKAIHKDDELVILYDVNAKGDVGSITAGQLDISENGDHLVFTKNPVLILNKENISNKTQ